MYCHLLFYIDSNCESELKNISRTLTGQMRDTRSPVVAISLSGSKRSLSWTVYKKETRLHIIFFPYILQKNNNNSKKKNSHFVAFNKGEKKQSFTFWPSYQKIHCFGTPWCGITDKGLFASVQTEVSKHDHIFFLLLVKNSNYCITETVGKTFSFQK